MKIFFSLKIVFDEFLPRIKINRSEIGGQNGVNPRARKFWFYSGVHLSFVRSATMDKWKASELEKMKVGGNRAFNDFLEEHDDYNPSWTIEEKYNSKSAALFRDKVATEAQGKVSKTF